METTATTSAEPRFRRRIPCSLRLAGAEHRALILNLSQTGLFVRTTATARPGEHVEVQITVDDSPATVELGADIVWRRIPTSSVSQTADGGFGLRLDSSPEAYSLFVRELSGEPEAETAPAADSPGEAAAEQATVQEQAPLLPSFEVLLKLRGSPRSRCLQLEAENEGDASARAVAEAGESWEILEVRSRNAPREAEEPA